MSTLLNHDLPCRACRYNLRGLLADARCPECGTPIPATLAPDELAAADPAWLRTLARGCLLLSIAAAAALLLFPFFVGLSLTYAGPFANPLFTMALPLATVPALLGALLITPREPAPIPAPALRRRLTRMLVPAGLLTFWLPNALPLLLRIALPGAAAALLFFHLHPLARRAGLRAAADLAAFTAWSLILATLLLTLPLLLGLFFGSAPDMLLFPAIIAVCLSPFVLTIAALTLFQLTRRLRTLARSKPPVQSPP